VLQEQFDVAGDALRELVGLSNAASNGVTSSECTPAMVADMASVVPRSILT